MGKKSKQKHDMMPRLFLIAGLLILVSGLNTYWIGHHNIDMGSNLKFLNEKLDIKLVDLNSDNEIWTPSEMYKAGLSNSAEGMLKGLLGMLLIGLGIR